MAQQPPPGFDIKNVAIQAASVVDLEALRDLFDMGCIEGLVPENDTGADIDHLEEAYFSDEGRSAFWVARWSSAVVGMVGVQRHADNVGEIRRLRVHRHYRRLGIGTRLMEASIGFCRQQGYLKVILDTRVERDGAIAMFEKFGFVHTKSREVDNRRLHDFYLDMYREPEQ